ncbi:DoxX family protein [Nocardia sp. NPDC023852]|uniref:DoxX family protein n=1 Tax=Nocardia sp. NPDC023852 TaxID=3154697 RepID=UPI0033E8649B
MLHSSSIVSSFSMSAWSRAVVRSSPGSRRSAAGLLVGLAVPPIGAAAAVGLVAYFLGAVLTVVWARWYSHIGYPLPYLVLAVASLGLFVAS